MTPTEPRVPFFKLAAKASKGLLDASQALHGGTLGRRLVDLVFLRVSQINGCAYCIDMHWRDLAAQDIDPRHLNSVAGWEESPFLDAREKAALRWAEALTACSHERTDAAAFAALREHFDDVQIAELGLAVGVINAWNRVAIGFRSPISVSPVA